MKVKFIASNYGYKAGATVSLPGWLARMLIIKGSAVVYTDDIPEPVKAEKKKPKKPVKK